MADMKILIVVDEKGLPTLSVLPKEAHIPEVEEMKFKYSAWIRTRVLLVSFVNRPKEITPSKEDAYDMKLVMNVLADHILSINESPTGE